MDDEFTGKDRADLERMYASPDPNEYYDDRVMYKDLGRASHNPTPLAFTPSPTDWWGNELGQLFTEYNCIVYQVDDLDRSYVIEGDGVCLRFSLNWIVETDAEELSTRILDGIKVSRDNRVRLGY